MSRNTSRARSAPPSTPLKEIPGQEGTFSERKSGRPNACPVPDKIPELVDGTLQCVGDSVHGYDMYLHPSTIDKGQLCCEEKVAPTQHDSQRQYLKNLSSLAKTKRERGASGYMTANNIRKTKKPKVSNKSVKFSSNTKINNNKPSKTIKVKFTSPRKNSGKRKRNNANNNGNGIEISIPSIPAIPAILIPEGETEEEKALREHLQAVEVSRQVIDALEEEYGDIVFSQLGEGQGNLGQPGYTLRNSNLIPGPPEPSNLPPKPPTL